MRSVLPALAVLALAPAVAVAQPPRTVRIGATRSMAPIPLSIAREEVELDCRPPDEARGTMPCDVRIRITLSNPGTESAPAPLLFTLENVEGATIGEPGITSTTEAPTLRPLSFPIPSGGERTLEIAAAIEIGRADSGSVGATDALAARHPVLATSTTGGERTFVYARPVAAHFLSVPDEVSLRVHVPEGSYLRVPDGWEATGTDRDRVVTVRSAGGAVHVDVPVTIRAGEPATEVIRNGGPFLALGATIGDGRPTTFRGRLGYEIGFLEWLIVSVAVESDFAHVAEVAVMIEAATPSLVIPPSVSVGIGLPIRVWSDTGATPPVSPTVGVRAAVGATLLVAGFEALFDYWPADSSWALGLLGRVGL